jgi:hypothetical protein
VDASSLACNATALRKTCALSVDFPCRRRVVSQRSRLSMNESRSHHGQWVPDSHVPLEGMLGQIAGSSWAWHASCSCPAHPHPSSASHWPPTCKLQSGSTLAVVVIRWNHLRLGMKLYLLDVRGEQMFPAASWMAAGACRLYVCFHLTTFIIHMGND